MGTEVSCSGIKQYITVTGRALLTTLHDHTRTILTFRWAGCNTLYPHPVIVVEIITQAFSFEEVCILASEQYLLPFHLSL